MNSDERVGWLGMGIGLVITLLPFIIPTIFYGGTNEIIIISIIGLLIFLIGASKALPEVLVSVYSELRKNESISVNTIRKDIFANKITERSSE